jgi:outer membrane lipoprotein-sorting protein
MFGHLAVAQTFPKVAEILENVSKTYSATQYEFVAEASGRGTTGQMRLAFKPPNRYRMEGVGLFGDDPGFDEMILVHDGAALWFYLPKSNQYGSFPASELTEDAPGDRGDLRPEAIDHFMRGRYQSASDVINGANFLREEEIEIGGAKFACYVVSISVKGSSGAYTWWVEKRSYRVLREDHAGSTAVYTTIKLGEPLSDSLFKFEPPPGSKRLGEDQN